MTPQKDYLFKPSFLHSLDEFKEIVAMHQESTSPDAVLAFNHDHRGYLERPIDRERCRDVDLFLRDMGSARFIPKGQPVFDWEALQETWTVDFQEMARATRRVDIFAGEMHGWTERFGGRVPVAELYEGLYAQLRTVPGIGATNASKLLAGSNIEAFPMWDWERERKVWNWHADAYVRHVGRVGAYGRFLIDEVKTALDTGSGEALAWLELANLAAPAHELRPRWRPLAKLVDEYLLALPKWTLARLAT